MKTFSLNRRRRPSACRALAAALLLFAGAAFNMADASLAAAQNITYTVNQPIGAGSVVGQIVTNGHTGVLATADIVSWNLTVNGVGATTTLTSAGAQSLVQVLGADLTATAGGLQFNYGVGDGGYFFFQAAVPGLFSGAKYYCNNTNWFGCSPGASVVPITSGDPSSQFDTSYNSLRTIAGLGAAPPVIPLGANLAPLIGTPGSLQFGLIDQALDPSTLGELDYDQPANLIGGQWSRTNQAGQGSRFDATYQRGFRILPGSRALLVVRVPVTYVDGPLAHEFRGIGTLSLEYPMTRNWTLQPSVSYGGFTSDNSGLSGQMTAGSLTSELIVANHGLGRGQLTLGNMIGYTKATHVKAGALAVATPAGSFVTRDGLAYDYPLNAQFDGRMTSLRASYTYTYAEGDQLAINTTQDVVLSMGVRSRGDRLRNSFELLRVGLRGEFADKYHAAFLFAGYRF